MRHPFPSLRPALLALAASAVAAVAAGAAGVTVRLENPLPRPRADVVVALDGPAFRALAGEAGPLAATLDGRPVPVQQAAHGRPALALVDLGAGAAATLVVGPGDPAAPAPARRAAAELSVRVGGGWNGRVYEAPDLRFEPVQALDVPPQQKDHSYFLRYEGPGWESDRVGFRLYLDQRNAIDVFGKRMPGPVLAGVGLDGWESYHQPAAWGMDILKVGGSLGAGSYGWWDGSAARRVEVTRSVRAEVLDGPLVAGHRVIHRGWQAGPHAVDLVAELSAEAGSRVAWVDLRVDGAIPNLATGLVRLPDTERLEGPRDRRWSWLATWGRQALDGDTLGLAILYPTGDLLGLEDDGQSHVVVLRPEAGLVRYGIVAAWGGEPGAPRTREAFVASLEQAVEELEHPVRAVAVAEGAAAGPLAVPADAAGVLAVVRRVADDELARRGRSLAFGEHDPEAGRAARWTYTTGLLYRGYEALHERTGDPRYRDASADVLGSYVSAEGRIAGYRVEEHNIDHLNPGKNLLWLHRATGEERYLLAARLLRSQLDTHPRTSAGGFWHKDRYPHQMWLDGLYMGAAFWAEFARDTGEEGAWEDIVRQFVLMEQVAIDPADGLLRHGWDEARAQEWADKETGRSPHVWGRAVGWYVAGLVDTIACMPEAHPGRATLVAILRRTLDGMLRFQQPDGRWYQVVDRSGDPGNYLESSVTAMVAYALAKGVNLGELPGTPYGDAARRAFDGLVAGALVAEADGGISLGGICQVAGLGNGRDGSYAYYLSEKIVRNDPKGFGPFVLAGLELERLLAARETEAHARAVAADPWPAMERVLARIQAPTFPDRDFPITDFGAVGDGVTDATAAIRAAIEACAAAGGGRVVVPPGEWATGAIHLRSRVNLHVSEGATLRFSTDPRAYLPIVETAWEGMDLWNYSSLIYAVDAEDIAVTGEGVLDGQASMENWWSMKGRWRGGDVSGGGPTQDAARDRLQAMMRAHVPTEFRRFGEGSYLRPNFVTFLRCRNVLLEGFTVKRSPMWLIHPVLCVNVTIRGLLLESKGPNNDGIDPESCRDVLIEDCVFDTGDDCIAIKSGRNEDGRRRATASENLVVRRCEMRDGHGGVVMGSEIAGSTRNIWVEDCVMNSPQLDRAIRLKTNSHRGGVIENLFVRRVRVGEVKQAVLLCDFYYEEGDGGLHAPVVRNLLLEQVTSGKSMHPLFLRGYERSPIRGIVLRDCRFEGATKPSVISHVADMSWENVSQNTGARTDLWGNVLP